MQVGVGPEESNGPWFTHQETEDKLVLGKGVPNPSASVQFEFCRKPMANQLVILARSGIPEERKVATMASEIKSRWKGRPMKRSLWNLGTT